MPSPNATPTPITPPRVPLIDPRTGLIDRAWYLFFLSLNDAATAVVDDSGLTFSAESTIASVDAELRTLAQFAETLPPSIDLSSELIKQIDAAGLADCCSALVSQVAELQKQIEALNLLPPPMQGTVTAVTATAPIVSSGGTTPNISVTAAALTEVDDTNVTLTLGGSPTTALLAATSLTLGWTGQLAVGRGGTGVATATANTVFAGPTTGAAAAPSFRALVAADIPSLPYTSTAAPVTQTANFSVGATDVWTINNKSGSSCTVTLPTASANTGRVLYFQNYQAQTLVSASSNVVPLAGGSATTAILEAVAGANATLVSNGTNWIMTQYSSNNSLQLE